jgi:hypothetical protein
MDKKKIFMQWAPQEATQWTKFVKPALFVNAEATSHEVIKEVKLPAEITNLSKEEMMEMMIIVDLPGKKGVEVGLAMAKEGFRPIPLYNGVHETKNGQLSPIVDNQSIINTLISGASTLSTTNLAPDAPPVFLLDAQRDPQNIDITGKYDNRWNIEESDFPSVEHLKKHGIIQVVLWTEGAVEKDVKKICNIYGDADIEVRIYTSNKFKEYRNNEQKAIETEQTESVLVGRNALGLALMMAVFNFFGMFFVNAEPFVWAPPTIMWLSYLWVPEIVGDAIAIVMVAIYVWLYLSSKKTPRLLGIAVWLFGIEMLIFYIYAMYYGLAAFTGYSFEYGLLVYLSPLFIIKRMLWATEGNNYLGFYREQKIRRSRFRGTGYRGYGGRGSGGYGGGYGGYGGFGG